MSGVSRPRSRGCAPSISGENTNRSDWNGLNVSVTDVSRPSGSAESSGFSRAVIGSNAANGFCCAQKVRRSRRGSGLTFARK